MEHHFQPGRLADQDHVRLLEPQRIERVGQTSGGSNIVKIVAARKDLLQSFQYDWLRFTGEYREAVQYIPLKVVKIDGDSMRV